MDPRAPYRPRTARAGTLVLRLAATVALAVTVAMVTLTAGTPQEARAHASLIGSEPPAGAVLDDAPGEVRLQFDEGVRVINDTIRVFDRRGARVDLADAVSDGATAVRASLASNLPDGGYLVSWQVVSNDGHPIRGSFGFSVGTDDPIDADTAAGLVGDDQPPIWDVAGWVTRALSYLGALLAGGLAVLYSRSSPDSSRASRLRSWTRVAAWLGIVAIGANILVQGVRLTGGGADAVADADAIEVALRQGGLLSALVSAAGLTVLVVIAGPLGVRWWTPGSRSWLAVPAALAAASGFALSGHAVTSDPQALVVFGNAVHVSAAALWFGGLVGLGLLLRPDRSGTEADGVSAADTVARFSGLAAIALGAVAATGLYIGWRIEGSWSGLFEGRRGTVLLAKVVLVGAVAALGAWNRFRLVPAAERGLGALRRLVIIESAVLVAVIGLTASLVIMAPGRADSAGGPAAAERVEAAPVETVDGAGNPLSITVAVAPGLPGSNQVLVTVEQGGNPFDQVDEVRLRLSQDEVGIGPLRATAEREAAGRWRSEALELAVGGTWQIEVFLATQAGVTSVVVDLALAMP